MTDSTDKPADAEKEAAAAGALVGKHVGGLIYVAILQARAVMELSSALKNDPNVSDETKAAATSAAGLVDQMIKEIGIITNDHKGIGGFLNGE